MLAFRKTLITKPAILKQLRAHAKADQIVKGGQYWKDGKGCAVGCTVHGSNHALYESHFGIPQMLARLEDCIFEGLPNEAAKKWPLRFMTAVQPGADLSRVGWQFLYWILTDEKVNPGINRPIVRDAIKQCADVLLPLTKGKLIDRSAARSAARSAVSAVSAAGAAGATGATWSAARSAVSAVSATWSAVSAVSAESATWSAVSAARSAAGAVGAVGAAYVRMADKLIVLIKKAPGRKLES